MSEDAADRIRLVVTTVPDAETGEGLVRELIEDRLIACGNLVPGATSIYRWESVVEKQTEVVVLMKTSKAAVPRVFERVAELHPYEVPELLAFAVESGSDAYCQWVVDEIKEVNA